MNDLTITVSGWVATKPRHVVGRNNVSLTSFRVASTSRYFDRAANAWEDGPTEWFTVRTFRSAALTVLDSIEKGQPVIVTGRLRTNTWESEAGPRTDLVIDASGVGHDLTRGIATFRRAVGDPNLGGVEPPTVADGDEADDAARVADAADSDAGPAGSDAGAGGDTAVPSNGLDAVAQEEELASVAP